MSIRSRLVLLVLAVLLPALGAMAWVVFRGWQNGHAAIDHHARDRTQALAMAVERELSRYSGIAHTLAASPLLDRAPPLAERDRLAFEDTARRAIAGLPASVQLSSGGTVWLDTRLPRGMPVSRAPPGAEPPAPLPPSNAPLAPAATRLVAGPSDEAERSLSLIEPVMRGESGRGARASALRLRLRIPLARLHHVLDDYPVPAGWGGWLLDADGQVLLHRPARDGTEPGLGARSADNTESPDNIDALPLLALMRESLAGQRRDGRFALQTAEGDTMRVYFRRAPGGWVYLTTVPRAQLAPGYADQAFALLLGAVLLLAAGVVAAVMVARGELRRQVDDAVQRARQAERWAARRERVEALGRLTGRVAHEFNNLLGVISNSAHLIQRHASTPALAMPLAATLRAVEAASGLMQHLLRFGGRRSARPRKLVLARWLPELRDMLGVVLGKRVVLEIEVHDEGLCVHVDPDELELALINLALNAREVLTEGGRVAVTAVAAPAPLTADLPPGRYVAISVRDDGPGMAPEQVRRAFEPFFTTKDDDPAAGFGLSQVHGLCSQAQGKAWLISQPGEGTIVTLVLPAVEPERPDAQGPHECTAPLAASVLVAEDNDTLGDVTVALIETMGARVERVTHAGQALERLERGPPIDVVLSDVAMPGPMDGVGLAHAVRARWPGVRVVLISANGGRLVGAESFLVLRKPCAPAVLLEALRPVLDGQEPRAGTPHAPGQGAAAGGRFRSTLCEDKPWTTNP
jgi:signal transduction histidine kinase